MPFVWPNKITFLLWWENGINREIFSRQLRPVRLRRHHLHRRLGYWILRKIQKFVCQPNGRIELRDVISLLSSRAVLPENGSETTRTRVVAVTEGWAECGELFWNYIYCMWHGTDINTRIIYPVLWREPFFSVFSTIFRAHAACINAAGPIAFAY